MIRYLADSTAVWRMQRGRALHEAWAPEIDEGAIGSCHPQRTEFRRFARRSQREYRGRSAQTVEADGPEPGPLRHKGTGLRSSGVGTARVRRRPRPDP